MALGRFTCVAEGSLPCCSYRWSFYRLCLGAGPAFLQRGAVLGGSGFLAGCVGDPAGSSCLSLAGGKYSQGKQALLAFRMGFAELGLAGLALLLWKSAHQKIRARKGGTVPSTAVCDSPGSVICRVQRASANLGEEWLSNRSLFWRPNGAKACVTAERAAG